MVLIRISLIAILITIFIGALFYLGVFTYCSFKRLIKKSKDMINEVNEFSDGNSADESTNTNNN